MPGFSITAPCRSRISFELEYGAGTPALLPCHLHVRVFFLALAPATATSSRFVHAVLLRLVSMDLSESQKKYLRGLGHQIKPTIMIGDAGLTDGVFREFDATIEHHELIKVRVRVGDRHARDATIKDLCNRSAATLVTRIGNVALVYRRNADKPQIPLPI